MRRVLIAAAIVGIGVPAWSMFMSWTGLPVDRAVGNLTRLLDEHPDDARLAYMLGRVHAYAFAFGKRLVPGRDMDERSPYVPDIVDSELFQTEIIDERRWLEAEDRRGQALEDDQREQLALLRDPQLSSRCTPEELRDHLSEGVRWHLRAIALDDATAEHHLGLAWLLEKGAQTAPSLAIDPLTLEGTTRGDVQGMQQVRVAQWLDRAEAEYLLAFESASPEDCQLTSRPLARGGDMEMALRQLVSYEAGRAVLRLMALRPAETGDPGLKCRLQEHLDQLFELPPPNFVTPVIFSLSASQPLETLLADHPVRFDLDGLGSRSWPWLQPDTALLVWDPDHTGNITSGLQLFGSVTWWIFQRDGYQALELLDDDGNGWLAGEELAGLALWQDRNGDGVSDTGEVTPIECTEIDALATHATGAVGRSLVSAQGLRLRDGRLLPTYDWVTAPAAEP